MARTSEGRDLTREFVRRMLARQNVTVVSEHVEADKAVIYFMVPRFTANIVRVSVEDTMPPSEVLKYLTVQLKLNGCLSTSRPTA